MSFIDNNGSIFINVFVHYPEVYNSSVISRRLEKYFINNKLIELNVNLKVYVTIKSAPHSEEQMIKVEFKPSNEIDESIKLDWKNYR